MTAHLDKSSKISIGLAITLIVFLLGGVGAFVVLKADVKILTNRLDQVLLDIEATKDERYRMTNASEDALRMAIENPGLRVPDPRNPGTVIVVEMGRIKSASSVPRGGLN